MGKVWHPGPGRHQNQNTRQQTLCAQHVTSLSHFDCWQLFHQNSCAAHLQKASAVPGRFRVPAGGMHQSRSVCLFSLVRQHLAEVILRSNCTQCWAEHLQLFLFLSVTSFWNKQQLCHDQASQIFLFHLSYKQHWIWLYKNQLSYDPTPLLVLYPRLCKQKYFAIVLMTITFTHTAPVVPKTPLLTRASTYPWTTTTSAMPCSSARWQLFNRHNEKKILPPVTRQKNKQTKTTFTQ